MEIADFAGDSVAEFAVYNLISDIHGLHRLLDKNPLAMIGQREGVKEALDAITSLYNGITIVDAVISENKRAAQCL
jgi:hypothetical protein